MSEPRMYHDDGAEGAYRHGVSDGRAALRAELEAHELIPLYGDGWLPQWSHVDWHCRCGFWGNPAVAGYDRHFREVVLGKRLG